MSMTFTLGRTVKLCVVMTIVSMLTDLPQKNGHKFVRMCSTNQGVYHGQEK